MIAEIVEDAASNADRALLSALTARNAESAPSGQMPHAAMPVGAGVTTLVVVVAAATAAATAAVAVAMAVEEEATAAVVAVVVVAVAAVAATGANVIRRSSQTSCAKVRKFSSR
jgi:hypothetical protein